MRFPSRFFAGFVFAACLGLSQAHALGKPPCLPSGDEADWRVYVDARHHFCFLYPKEYVPTDDGKGVRETETLHSPDVDILIGCCERDFDLQALVRRAPTGVEFPPEPYVAGSNKFYYYGPGGGGVSYADQFFYQLHGQTLSIDFDGGYEKGNTPSAAIKRLERRILSTFRTY